MKFFLILINFVIFTYSKTLTKKYIHNEYIDEELEKHAINFMNTHYEQNKSHDDYEQINIPIIFHIIYNDYDQYNINYQKFKIDKNFIETYILDNLNKDFNLKNDDKEKTPEIWKDLMADFKINFTINKIKYTFSNKKYWNIDNKMKFNKFGGSDVVDPELNLNVWIVNIPKDSDGSFIAGYAQFPSEFKNSPETDGYVLNALTFFYNDYRTSTHEIGHWMNLRHIWGDGGCNDDDGVNDTPASNTNHIECGSSIICTYPKTSSCGSPDMFMNFMSYGEQTNMFTKGQMLRARSVFAKNGVRYSIVTQNKNDAPKKKPNMYMIFIFIIFIVLCFLLFYCCYRQIRNSSNYENIEEDIEMGNIN